GHHVAAQLAARRGGEGRSAGAHRRGKHLECRLGGGREARRSRGADRADRGALRAGPRVTRVLVLGLDSADAELIERWADAGHLPSFPTLRRDGTWGRLGTTAEVLHVSAWPTIYTGARPGHPGLYHAYHAQAGTHALPRPRAEWGALRAFWQLLDRAGRRCLVMDAFMDRPLDD